jgi:Multimeric flavodoxin WrbA
MKIVLLNGSPKGDKSDTLTLSRAFLEGINQEFERIDLIDWNIFTCTGCGSCLISTPGKCALQDDVAMLLDDIKNADLVVWSMPMYAFGMPSHVKALLDRILPISSSIPSDSENDWLFNARKIDTNTKHVLVSGCGFSCFMGNFDAMIIGFRSLFGKDSPCIICEESSILNLPEFQLLVQPYLELVRKAGREYFETGTVSAELQEIISIPMVHPAIYRNIINERLELTNINQ